MQLSELNISVPLSLKGHRNLNSGQHKPSAYYTQGQGGCEGTQREEPRGTCFQRTCQIQIIFKTKSLLAAAYYILHLGFLSGHKALPNLD